MPSDAARNESTRRSFLQTSAVAASAAALATAPRTVHAGVNEKLRVCLIGAGGRGTGAAIDALTADGQAELVAVADAFEDRARQAVNDLKGNGKIGDRVNVGEDCVFWGFDAYKKAIDSGVDVVILATPPHFRPEHLEYVAEQGKHCFVEKPVAVDVPGIARVEAASKKMAEKGKSLVSGLCWRYDLGVRATMNEIAEGAIGDIISIESRYNAGELWHRGDDPSWSRMEYQIRNWLYHTWLSGDHIVEQAIHSLDKTAWLQGDASPISAMGIGGRQKRTDPKWGDIFDHHVVFFEYESGIPVFFTCRQQDGTSTFVDEIVYGTKGKAQILANKIEGEKRWRYRGPKPSMYTNEHVEFFKSIRDDKPIDNSAYMCNSTKIAIMGRMATYTGKTLTWDELSASTDTLGPKEYTWGDAPEAIVAVPGVTRLA